MLIIIHYVGNIVHMYEHYDSNNYKIEIPSSQKYFLNIYYKKMLIVWTLQEYIVFDINSVAKKILDCANNTKYYGLLKIFVCENKKDLNVIYRHLYSAYFEHKDLPSLNIIEQSLKNFVSSDDEWHTYDLN